MDQPTCQPITQCGNYTFQGATPSSDAICSVCPADAYARASDRTCVTLTTCAPGSFVVADATPTTDRACQSCPGGTYQTSDNQKHCDPAVPCDPGTYVARGPSATAAAECKPCPAGTFASKEDAAACVSHSGCPPGTYEALPPTAFRNRVCYFAQLAHTFVDTRTGRVTRVGCFIRNAAFVTKVPTLTKNIECAVRIGGQPCVLLFRSPSPAALTRPWRCDSLPSRASIRSTSILTTCYAAASWCACLAFSSSHRFWPVRRVLRYVRLHPGLGRSNDGRRPFFSLAAR